MLYSAKLIDKLIIFTGCLIIYFCQTDFKTSVVTLLISIIFGCFLSYFDNDRIRTILTMGFSAMSLFVPGLIFFLPLMAYDMLYYKYQHINLVALIPMLCFLGWASVQAIFMVTAVLLFSLLIRYRAEAQIRLHDKYNKLSDTTREMTIQLKKQNRELIEKQDYELNLATLNERNRIAREIHDSVGHLLSSAILQAGALITVNKDEKIKNSLETLNSTLSQAMTNIRTSVHELYDESIDLNAQIEDIVRQFTFCDISYDYNISSNPGKKLKYAFIFIVREALANIIKHSNATNAGIILREHPAFYQLIIRDNGTVKGCSVESGMGLKNMIDRVHSFNGNINIRTENGFEIFISIPKEEIPNENIGNR